MEKFYVFMNGPKDYFNLNEGDNQNDNDNDIVSDKDCENRHRKRGFGHNKEPLTNVNPKSFSLRKILSVEEMCAVLGILEVKNNISVICLSFISRVNQARMYLVFVFINSWKKTQMVLYSLFSSKSATTQKVIKFTFLAILSVSGAVLIVMNQNKWKYSMTQVCPLQPIALVAEPFSTEPQPPKMIASKAHSKVVKDTSVAVAEKEQMNDANLVQTGQRQEKSPYDYHRLNPILDKINRYFYLGSLPIEKDSSRVELFEPVGYHTVQVGRFQLTIPAVTRTASFNAARMSLDVLNYGIPPILKKSKRLNDFVKSIVDSLEMGPFYSRSISKINLRRPSCRLILRNLCVKQLDYITQLGLIQGGSYGDIKEMKDQLSEILVRNIEIEQGRHTNLFLQNNAPEPLLGEQVMVNPVIYQNVLRYLGRTAAIDSPGTITAIPTPITGQLTIPGIPTTSLRFNPNVLVIKTLHILHDNRRRMLHIGRDNDRRIRVNGDQVKSRNAGFFYKISILPPALIVLPLDEGLKSDINKYFTITITGTTSDVMKTNLIRLELNLGKLGIDVVRKITEKVSTRSTLIQQIKPVLHKFFNVVDSSVNIKVCSQFGTQQSNCYNFNFELENQRVNQMEHYLYNRVIIPKKRAQGYAISARVPDPVDPNLQEVHCRSFQDHNFHIWLSIDLIKIFDNLTR